MEEGGCPCSFNHCLLLTPSAIFRRYETGCWGRNSKRTNCGWSVSSPLPNTSLLSLLAHLTPPPFAACFSPSTLTMHISITHTPHHAHPHRAHFSLLSTTHTPITTNTPHMPQVIQELQSAEEEEESQEDIATYVSEQYLSLIALYSYTQICERIWCPTALCPVGRRDPGVWGSHSCTGAAARVKGGRSASSEGRTAGVWAEDPGIWGRSGEGHKEDGGATGVGCRIKGYCVFDECTYLLASFPGSSPYTCRGRSLGMRPLNFPPSHPGKSQPCDTSKAACTGPPEALQGSCEGNPGHHHWPGEKGRGAETEGWRGCTGSVRGVSPVEAVISLLLHPANALHIGQITPFPYSLPSGVWSHWYTAAQEEHWDRDLKTETETAARRTEVRLSYSSSRNSPLLMMGVLSLSLLL